MGYTPKWFILPNQERSRWAAYLQDANLSGFLIVAVFAGLQLSLQVAQSVGEQLFIQLVVVSLLTCKKQLLLLPWYLVRAIIIF